MKKIICAVVVILMLCALCSCGNNQSSQPSQEITNKNIPSSQSQESEDPSTKGNPMTKELFGYKYSFPDDATLTNSTSGGVAECQDCSIFIFKLDTIDFSDWTEIIDVTEEKLFDSLFSAFRIHFYDQKISSQNEIENEFGEKMLYVEGNFDTSDGDKEFIAYYHVTNDNKIRFFISIVDGNRENVKSVIEYMAKNLAKA